ncbi:MAG: hypothetical protein AABY64_00765 [Bdellovibrionota bacterium]
MKNRKVLGFIFILIVLAVYQLRDFSSRNAFSTSPEGSASSFLTQKKPTENPPAKNQDPRQKDSSSPNLLQSFETEVDEIGQLDEHPDQTEAKLKNQAGTLNEAELKELKSKALDPNQYGDDRMLAIYMLSLSQHPISAHLLEEIALSPFEKDVGQNSNSAFEIITRAQAIEGLQNREDKQQAVKSLSKLTAKLSDSNLLDRAQRALSHHHHATPRVEDQDLEALEKFVR